MPKLLSKRDGFKDTQGRESPPSFTPHPPLSLPQMYLHYSDKQHISQLNSFPAKCWEPELPSPSYAE